jgi:type IV secretory pathway VirB10-like protein
MQTKPISPAPWALNPNKQLEIHVPRGIMKIQQRITKILSTILAAALCFTPEILSAATQQQNAQPSAPVQSQPQSNDQQQTQSQPQPQSEQQSGTTVDPSKAPLQPVTTYPDAPTPQQDQQQTERPVTTITQPAPQEPQRPTEPVGAAAAEKAQTAGGAASKPAGAAIAPAKQHQTRGLLLKIGAIAAGGLAAGTVYALTRGTSSKPPGATSSGVTQK